MAASAAGYPCLVANAHTLQSARQPGSPVVRLFWLTLMSWLVILLSGCIHATPANPEGRPGSPSVPSTPATPSIPAAHDMLTPGLAQEVTAELVAAAGGDPIVRLVLDRTRLRITYVAEDARPRSLVWQAGAITPSDDGTDLVTAVSFDPNRFNLTDVATLFTTAAGLSGSNTRQELQINEYNHGQVLMTITTTPESSTVFFDREGVLIPRLDLGIDADLARGLGDVLDGRVMVVQIGITRSQRVWADLVVSPGIVERRIRPVNMPMYLTQRRETPGTEQFDASLVDPAVLGLLLRTAPGLLGEDPGTPVSLQVFQPEDAPAPRIVVDVAASQLVTDLAGAPLTEP